MSERVPEPLEMSDTEIVDWMSERCDHATLDLVGQWWVSSHSAPPISKYTFRDAVCLAAAYDKEANRDF